MCISGVTEYKHFLQLITIDDMIYNLSKKNDTKLFQFKNNLIRYIKKFKSTVNYSKTIK